MLFQNIIFDNCFLNYILTVSKLWNFPCDMVDNPATAGFLASLWCATGTSNTGLVDFLMSDTNTIAYHWACLPTSWLVFQSDNFFPNNNCSVWPHVIKYASLGTAKLNDINPLSICWDSKNSMTSRRIMPVISVVASQTDLNWSQKLIWARFSNSYELDKMSLAWWTHPMAAQRD